MTSTVTDKRRSPQTIAAWNDSATIIKRYTGGEDIPAIAKAYQTSVRPIISILKASGTRIRPHSEWSKHRLNRFYFDKIDSHEKAQILGFIYADGCVAENGSSYKLIIQLHEKDKDYLEYIRQKIGYSGPIRRVRSKKAFHENLVVHSRPLSMALIGLGATPRKTFTLDFPTESQVPRQYWFSFIRGFMEGDGSIYQKTYRKGNSVLKYTHVSFRGTEIFLTKLRDLLSQHDIRSSLSMDCGRIGLLAIGAKQSVVKLLQLIYQDADFVMQRKFDRAKPLLT